MRGVGCRARGVVGGREIGTGMGWDEWARAAGALSSQLWHGHGRRRDALHFVVSAAALRLQTSSIVVALRLRFHPRSRSRFAIALSFLFTQSLCDCAFSTRPVRSCYSLRGMSSCRAPLLGLPLSSGPDFTTGAFLSDMFFVCPIFTCSRLYPHATTSFVVRIPKN